MCGRHLSMLFGTLQEDSGDSQVTTLREALQGIERSGFIDWSLGGHACNRPADVAQGRSDDRFDIVPESGNPLVWRASAINQKQLKAINCASHFSADTLNKSPLVCVLWPYRLRCWISNQCFGFCFHLCFLGNSDSKILIFAWSIALPYLGLEASKVSDGTLHCCSQAALVPPIWALFGEGRLQKGCVASSFGVLSLQWPQQTWPRNSVWEPYHFDVAMCCVERSI